jgi:hypothetical protein
VEKCGRTGEATRDSITQRMRLVCGITKAKTHNHNVEYLLPFYGKNGYMNARQCYVIRTLPVSFIMK